MGVSRMYWACARAQPQREAVAQHFLELAGYSVYLPRVREHRVSHGRKIEIRPPLFPGYLFVEIVVGWWQARWCPGTLGLVMNCGLPVRVPDAVLDDIRKREVRGLVELPRPSLKPGDRVRIGRGPFEGRLALYDGQPAPERVAVLLQLLGAERRLELAADAVEALP
jgi:transcriptional antiterminator RfaH